MFCKKCGNQFEGKFCPACGTSVDAGGYSYEIYKPFLCDKSEKVVSVLGNSIAQSFSSTGEIGEGFAILTDKRVYFKGKCLFRTENGFYSKIEEKFIDVKSVIGTGFVHSVAIWAKVLMYVSIALLALMLLFIPTTMMSTTSSPSVSSTSSSSIDPSTVITLILILMIPTVLIFLFRYLYKKYTYTVFEITHTGGAIAFDMRYITVEETQDFEKNLLLLNNNILC